MLRSSKDGETSQSRHATKMTEHKMNEMALSVKWEDICDFKPSSVVLEDAAQTVHQNRGNPDESYSMNGDSQKSRHDKISDPNFVETVPQPQFADLLSKIEFPGIDVNGFEIPVDNLEYTYTTDESELHGSYSAIKNEKLNEYVSEADFSSSKAVSDAEMLTSVGNHDTEWDSTNNVLYQCLYCEATSNNRTSLRNHQAMCAKFQSTQVQQKTCDVCGKTFIDSHTYQLHIKLQLCHKLSGDKLYTCDQCDYRCAKKSHLQRHRRKHTGEKPYKCDQCDYRCAVKSNLLKHSVTHTGERPYKCDLCDFRCKLKHHLQRHQMRHKEQKPHKCDQCDYRCTRKSNLKSHMMTHTGEKPYKCDQCDYRCVSKSNLTQHQISHTGEKPYKCDQCDNRFVFKSSLVHHQRSHRRETLQVWPV